MTQDNRAIVPATHGQISKTAGVNGLSNIKRPGGNHTIIVHQHHYHQAPAPGPQPEQRPSHYTPKPMQDSGLGEVAKWGLASFTALFVALILGTAIASWGNAAYWQSERQHQRIYNTPTGGSW